MTATAPACEVCERETATVSLRARVGERRQTWTRPSVLCDLCAALVRSHLQIPVEVNPIAVPA